MPWTLRAAVRTLVERALRRDARYYPLAYRKADLSRDHWSVVGPATAEAFVELGHGKRRQLIALGLTPSSRILDVGCGTGLLAAALEGYLDDDGRYVGTDIAAEAIAFCRARHRRPNFHFVQSRMTSLPLDADRFELVFFGSVFTHVYPREVAALVAEARRLLAAGGAIVADAFLAPGIGGHRGGRGMVVLDEARLLAIFAAAGLAIEVVQRYPFASELAPAAGVERAIFRLRPRP